MSTPRFIAPRRPRPTDFSAVTWAARLHLCAVDEEPEVRRRHIAALLAFTPTVVRVDTRMRIRFEHGATALWLSQVLAHKDVALADVSTYGGAVTISNPQIVLGRYGFRDGRWVFGRDPAAVVGVSRGAVHAAATFSRRGMQVLCPSAPMMLTVAALLARLGIKAQPSAGEPRAVVGPGRVVDALDRLGIANVGAQYHLMRESNAGDGL